MTSRLLVAAGGGGDAVAAVMIAQATSPSDVMHVATFSWDRLVVDPLPGPREPSDFLGLEPVGRWNHRVTGRTSPRAPAGSSLPRLAAELPARFYLLDAGGGTAGLRRQCQELAELLGVDRISIVDVGGDILAGGQEPSLRSPIADSLILSAVHDLVTEAGLVLTGPGLDGELSEDDVVERCTKFAAGPAARLSPSMAAPFRSVFEWHPSEATGLLWAAAVGVRGRVEVRDHGGVVTMTDHSAEVWNLDASAAFALNGVARRLGASTSLKEAEAIVRAMTGRSEIRYERDKATSLARDAGVDLRRSLGRLPAVESVTVARGLHLMTLRRVAQALHLSGGERSRLIRELRHRNPRRCLPPLWAVDDEGERLLGRVSMATQGSSS